MSMASTHSCYMSKYRSNIDTFIYHVDDIDMSLRKQPVELYVQI